MDLTTAIMNSSPPLPAYCAKASPEEWSLLPDTLTAALLQANGNARIVFMDQQGHEQHENYATLIAHARQIASGWRKEDVKPDCPVLIQLTSSEEIIKGFWGCLFAGLRPVILPVPASFDAESRPVEQIRHLFELMDHPKILGNFETLSGIQRSPRLSDLHAAHFFAIEDLRQTEDDGLMHIADFRDTAFYTLSSGSTGLPKAVTLTHENMIARCRGANALCGNSSEDLILSWLPFDHIGNISAYHVSPILCSSDLVYVPKEYVLARPTRWLDLLHKFRATHTWAPNFAFGLIAKQLARNGDDDAQVWDLSCVRGLLSAGELIAENTVKSFLAATHRYGLRSEAVISAFGMAEVCSGVNYHLPPKGSAIEFAHLDRNSLDGKIEEVPSEDPQSIAFANLGPIIPGMAMRIVDEAGNIKHEGEVGTFQLKGPALMPGYHNNPQANEAFTDDGWFDTGDAAFIKNENLFLLGRTALGIVINGVNLSNHDVENVIEEIDSLEPSYTAACAAFPPGESTLKLVVFFHPKNSADEIATADIKKKIQAQLSQRLGIKADYLIALPQEAIPKTEIGKIQHKRLITQFQAGEFEEKIREQQIPIHINTRDGSAQSKLLEIWSELLPGTNVGVDDNFFELGADSLILMQAVGQIQEEIPGRVSLVDLFKHPTIRSLVDVLTDGVTGNVLEQAKARRAFVRNLSGGESDDIAVIGMAARFPGADSIDEFWENLINGVESISRFSDNELQESGFSRGVYDRPEYVKASPMLKDARRFDAEFFGYSTVDAELMDPQQRQFLEVAWEAFEDAGYDPTNYPGVVGVYAGAAMNTYLFNNVLPNRAQLDPNDDLAVATLDSLGGFMAMVGNDKDYITTRTSYKLNLGGPSVNVQTACSTGLVCIHMASQALRSGEADLFVAGCSSIQSPEHAGHLYQPGMIVSPDGHVRSFDAKAGGTIFGSGVGAVILKRCKDAIRDRDHIHAVIKGTAINNDAGAKVGYAAPSSDGQAVAVAAALAMADVPANTIGLVEAHGTGTVVGDPIEFDGLRQAYQVDNGAVGFCALGSVKTNVGHLQITSGTAGFIKAALAVQHGKIPPLLNFESANPALDIDASPFFINTSAIDWPISGPRRAGVNSLGIGGTNAHIILEEPPALESPSDTNDRSWHVLHLSARTPNALQQLAGRHIAELAKKPPPRIADYCFTANTGRKEFKHSLSVIGRSAQELCQQLDAWVSATDLTPAVAVGEDDGLLAFVFTGQGSQYANIASELYASQPTFKLALDECAKLFTTFSDVDVVHHATDPSVKDADLLPTQIAQPVIFSVGYALAQLWLSWGVKPSYVMGHSLGEYIAACVAGIFPLEAAIEMVSLRASLMQRSDAIGEMWAVELDARAARKALAGREGLLAVAAENGPQSCVISGDATALGSVINAFKDQGIGVKKLDTSHAFHSPLMQTVKARFEEQLSEIRYESPSIPIISNLTGELGLEEMLSSEYWAEHICRPVLFRQSIAFLEEAGVLTYLEIGATPTLSSAGMMCTSESARWIPSLNRRLGNWESIARSVATLAQLNLIDLKKFDGDYSRRRLRLPAYPFAKTSFWMESANPQNTSVQRGSDTLLGQRLGVANIPITIYQNRLDPVSLPVLRDHVINGVPVVSAAAMVAMMLSAARKTPEFLGHDVSLTGVTFEKALLVDSNDPPTVQTIIHPGDAKAKLWSRLGDDDSDLLHSVADIQVRHKPLNTLNMENLEELRKESTSVNAFIEGVRRRGIELGQSYRWTKSLYVTSHTALAELQSPARLGMNAQADTVHPGLIDTCFGLLLATAKLPADETWLPFGIDELHCAMESLVNAKFALFTLSESSSDSVVIGDGQIIDDAGNVLVSIRGLHARRLDFSALLDNRPEKAARSLYHRTEWQSTDIPRNVKSGLRWAIVGDSPFSESLQRDLKDAGCTVTVVDPIRALDVDCDGVISLLSFSPDQPLYEPLEQNRELLKSLASGSRTLPAGLWLISKSAYQVHTDEIAEPHQTAVRGLCVSARREQPELGIRHLDLGTADDYRFAVNVMLSNASDACIAVRGDKAFVERMEALTNLAHPRPAIHPDKTYIVSGARGALGRRVVEWLVDLGAKHLLLLSREWPKSATAIPSHDDVVIQRINCDVSDRNRLETALTSSLAGMPSPAGLFHCAGLLKDELVVNSESEAFRAVLSGKAMGAQLLDNYFHSEALDHFVLFSSAASILGNEGQTAYAAANAFLDGVAHQRAARGLPSTCINWGPFSGTGMATDETAAKQLKQQGFRPLDPGGMGDWLAASISSKHTQIMVVDCDWPTYGQVNPSNASLLSALIGNAAASSAAGRITPKVDFIGLDSQERRKTLYEVVSKTVASLLGITDESSLSENSLLSDLGLDSLLSVQLRNRLGEATGLSLPVALAFNYPTLAELAAFIESELTGTASETIDHAKQIPDSAAAAKAVLDDLEELLHAKS